MRLDKESVGQRQTICDVKLHFIKERFVFMMPRCFARNFEGGCQSDICLDQ